MIWYVRDACVDVMYTTNIMYTSQIIHNHPIPILSIPFISFHIFHMLTKSYSIDKKGTKRYGC